MSAGAYTESEDGEVAGAPWRLGNRCKEMVRKFGGGQVLGSNDRQVDLRRKLGVKRNQWYPSKRKWEEGKGAAF